MPKGPRGEKRSFFFSAPEIRPRTVWRCHYVGRQDVGLRVLSPVSRL